MNNTRSYSCFQRLLHFDCDPFRSSSCSTSVVQLLSIQLHHRHRPHAMMKIQFFKKKWLTDFRQMSHMKIDPQSDTVIPPDNVQTSNVVNKQEDDDEEDFDDTMTEVAPNDVQAPNEIIQKEPIMELERLPEPEPEPEPEKEPEKESNGKERNREKTRDRERRKSQGQNRSSRTSKDRWEFVPPQPVDNESNSDTVPIASRIKIRRQTMVADRPSSAKPDKGTKRRLSVSDRFLGSDSHRTRSGTANEIDSHNAKKMRLSNGVSEKQTLSKSVPEPSRTTTRIDTSTPKHTKTSNHAKSTVHNNSTASEKLSTSSTTTTTPVTSTPVNKSMQKTREKKSKGSSTPLITKFFSQTSPLKCDTCPAILNSQNELNFHTKIHKRGRCIKCKETIDNNNAMNSIQRHTISCLFTANEIPKEYLTHLLKVKVDLNRLTPDKIDKIQKSLHPPVVKRKPGPKSRKNERQIIESESVNRSGDKSGDKPEASEVTENAAEKSTEKTDEIPVEKMTDKTAEEAKASNEDGNDDKPASKKSKVKKTPNKPRASNGEISEEFIITGNQSAALNWIDEAIKEKPFAIRNFETDKPVYNTIKLVPIQDDIAEKKIAMIIENMKIRKTNAVSQAKENSQRPSGLNVATPTKPSEIGVNRSKPIENGSGRAAPNVPTPLQSPNQNGSITTPILTRLNSSQVSVTVQPIAVDLVTPPNRSPVMSNPIPSIPQLLSLPQRVPMRNRAISMHMSQSEYTGAGHRLSMRRQSVCDNNQPPQSNSPSVPPNTNSRSTPPNTNSPSAPPNINSSSAQPKTYSPSAPPNTNSPSLPSRATASNHSYPNSTAVKIPQPTIKVHSNGTYLLPPPYMTKVHHTDLMQNRPSPHPQMPHPSANKITPPPHTLKVLTPDDLNSRAMNAAQTVQASPNPRMDSPNSTENHGNLNNNNNNHVTSTKRPRTKTTPMRTQTPTPMPQLSDDANISISVSLSRVGTDRAELILTLDNQRLVYDNLTAKRKQEVQSSLLKDNVWLQMLNHLKTIQPTNDTLVLFAKILPENEHNQFLAEIKRVYGNRMG